MILTRILLDTLREWIADKAPSLGAALAFYSMLSLGPLLLIVIAFAGLVFGQEAASGHVVAQIRALVGNDGAEAIQAIIANSRNQTSGVIATVIGVITLMFAATAVFGQLQDALNIIWKVEAKPRGLLGAMQKRFLSFTMIVSIGFLLLISLIVSASLAAFGAITADIIPEAAMQLVNFVVSFGVVTLLFAMIYKILPDVNVRWQDVWIGAAITALLFEVGKLGIGMYLGHSALSSTYGAAGSLIVILLWIYYSTQILFLGAEFTQVYARYTNQYLTPINGAKPA